MILLLLLTACVDPPTKERKPASETPQPTADPVDACAGGDEDADGLVDCADPDCDGPACPEDCIDARDNDGSGLADCADPACWCADACPCDVDGDGYPSAHMGGMDCDDNNVDVNLGAIEQCNGLDDDCDALEDDDDPDVVIPDGVTMWKDADLDGFGDVAQSSVRCGPGTGWVLDDDDCDDSNGTVHPNTTELCGDGLDNDCDDLFGDDDPDVDTSGTPSWPDEDEDGYGDEDAVPHYCDHPAGWVVNGDDCNDERADVNPDTLWYPDVDADGFGDPTGITVTSCKKPDDDHVRIGWGDDCDDVDANINPDMVDDCDFVDSNCDGSVDDASSAPSWVFDSDGDGFGVDPWPGAPSCLSPALGWVDVAPGLDCDDAEPSLGAPGDWFADLDGDGVGADFVALACEAPADATAVEGDCDDADPSIPGPVETCGTGDEDCDGAVGFDDHVNLSTTMDGWLDLDGDGFGDAATYVPWCQDLPLDVATNDDDCDDSDPHSRAGLAYRFDGDGDGFGAGEPLIPDTVCVAPGPGYVDDDFGVDCDDADGKSFPGGIERHANGVDDDCDALEDEATTMLLSDVASETWRWPQNVSFGSAIGVGGDLDGDGRPEILVGAPYNNGNDGALLWAGPSGELRVWIEGSLNNVGLARPVLQDMDADGATDVVVGTEDEDYAGTTDVGTARTFFGPVLDEFATRSLEASGAVVAGLDTYGRLGHSVAAGDIDDDGIADLLIGSYVSDGGVYLFRGPQAPVSLAPLADTAVTGASYLGADVEAFGDIDGDGVAEWGAGAYLEAPSSAVYLFSGLPLGELLAEDAPIVLRAETASDNFGLSVAPIGDVTGDGLADVGVAAPYLGADERGRIYVFSAPLSGEIAAVDAKARIYSLVNYSYCGLTGLGAPGDLDGDGTADLAVPCSSRKLYVLFGAFDGAFDVASAPSAFETSLDAYPVVQSAPVDVDVDGFNDLVVGDEDGDDVYLLYGPF